MPIFLAQPPKQVFFSVNPDDLVGPIMLGVTEDGFLCRLSFLQGNKPTRILKEWQKEWKRTIFIEDPQKIRTLSARMKKAKEKNLPLLLVGTPFQLKVWKALMTIKPGQTLSYGALARKIGNPKAARAIGGAVGKNPIPLIVPCHRVIAGDGSIGGFSGPMNVKKELLSHEGAFFR